MSDVYHPPKRIQDESHCKSMKEYLNMYQDSISNPSKFWRNIAKDFHWQQFPSEEKFFHYNFDIRKGPIDIKWMEDGKTNMSYNVLDRHLEKRATQIAFYWEGNDPRDTKYITYSQLFNDVCLFANVLKSRGVVAGDRVAIYMPMIVELIVAMLACARIGAVHSIVFGGYSADSLATRILDANAKVFITADGVWRGSKLINLLEIAEAAIETVHQNNGHKVETNIVVRHLPRLESSLSDSSEQQRYAEYIAKNWRNSGDFWWHDLMVEAAPECEPVWMNAEDPLFMLYTSGSTGKPKGVLHTLAGYMIYTGTTFKYSFDYQQNDIYWCTADIGWITGHSYVTYGPLLNGAISVIFEGMPFYPNNERFWQIINKYAVTKFYTAPTAIRALMKYGSDFTHKYDLSCLKVLGTVGEPINPEAWMWYHKYVGNTKCSIVDTYWQTETGGHVLTPLPGCTPTKPGSACFPFFGVVPVILDEAGNELNGICEGYIAFKQPWPGIMRTVYENHELFETVYFKRFPGYYMTGDGAKRDSDGYIWITGRIDDMLNCSGHLMSTAHVESVLLEFHDVAEAAVVSCPHPIKGECLYCFITPKDGATVDASMKLSLNQLIRNRIAPFAQPDYIQEAPNLPKTRSGKIMRRILRKIATGEPLDSFGDISTMSDPGCVKELLSIRNSLVILLE